MRGSIIGIGVGPGDGELITLKAFYKIKEADIIFVPGKKTGRKCRLSDCEKRVSRDCK